MEHIAEPSSRADQSDMPSSWEKGLRSPLTFGLVSCGGIGAFLFTVTYLIEGFTRPGYDAWQQPISALSLGPGGWVQQVNFVVFGVLMVLSACWLVSVPDARARCDLVSSAPGHQWSLPDWRRGVFHGSLSRLPTRSHPGSIDCAWDCFILSWHGCSLFPWPWAVSPLHSMRV